MPETAPMNKQSEQRLLDAVRDVSAHVESGIDPTTAVVKSAQRHKLGRDMLPLVVQAYNVGRTTYQQSVDGGILDKQADFPIARLEDVIGQLYPASPHTPAQLKSATAVSSDYALPPTVRPGDDVDFEKAAHATDIRLPEAQRALSHQDAVDARLSVKIAKAYKKIDQQKQALDSAGRDYRMAREYYLGTLGRLREYFKQASFLRKPFDEVEYHARLMFGEPAGHALQYAYDANRMKEVRAKGPPLMLAAATSTDEPYSMVKAAMDAGIQLIQSRRTLKAIEKVSDSTVADALRPFASAPGPNGSLSVLGNFDPSSIRAEKAAGLLGKSMLLGTGAYLRGPRSDPDKLVGEAEQALSDPEHVSMLREIEVRAMLQDLMMNDEVISGYDPEEVLAAYNEIAQLSPRASSQPAIIRPLLRKHLTQGAMEPFEAQQMTEIEKTLGETVRLQDESIAPNTNIMQVPGASGKSNVLDGNPLFGG